MREQWSSSVDTCVQSMPLRRLLGGEFGDAKIRVEGWARRWRRLWVYPTNFTSVVHDGNLFADDIENDAS